MLEDRAKGTFAVAEVFENDVESEKIVVAVNVISISGRSWGEVKKGRMR